MVPYYHSQQLEQPGRGTRQMAACDRISPKPSHLQLGVKGMPETEGEAQRHTICESFVRNELRDQNIGFRWNDAIGNCGLAADGWLSQMSRQW
jgi:hypothetical protein